MKWAIILLLLIVADSVFTIIIGQEANPVILYMMDIFKLSLYEIMILRIFLLFPLVYIVYKREMSKIVSLLYMGIYIIFTGVQFI